MERIFTTESTENAAEGAIDLMAKLAVLIVAALLFAGYGIREGRTQPIQARGWQATAPAQGDKVVMLKRFATERSHTAAQAARKAARPPLTDF